MAVAAEQTGSNSARRRSPAPFRGAPPPQLLPGLRVCRQPSGRVGRVLISPRGHMSLRACPGVFQRVHASLRASRLPAPAGLARTPGDHYHCCWGVHHRPRAVGAGDTGLWPLDCPAEALVGGAELGFSRHWSSPNEMQREPAASRGLLVAGGGVRSALPLRLQGGHGGLPAGRGPRAGLVVHVCRAPAVGRSPGWAVEGSERPSRARGWNRALVGAHPASPAGVRCVAFLILLFPHFPDPLCSW